MSFNATRFHKIARRTHMTEVMSMQFLDPCGIYAEKSCKLHAVLGKQKDVSNIRTHRKHLYINIKQLQN